MKILIRMFFHHHTLQYIHFPCSSLFLLGSKQEEKLSVMKISFNRMKKQKKIEKKWVSYGKQKKEKKLMEIWVFHQSFYLYRHILALLCVWEIYLIFLEFSFGWSSILLKWDLGDVLGGILIFSICFNYVLLMGYFR